MATVRPCPCGEDHSSSPSWLDFLKMLGLAPVGDTVPITAPGLGRTWDVPRVWIAFHGLKIVELPELAARYGWPEVFECPKCGAVSHNANDVREGYCGRCNAFTS